MPRYTTEVTHTLGTEEALARLKALTERAHRYSDLKGYWSAGTFEFSVSVQGFQLSGTLRVEADVLKLEAQVPLLAMPFAGWFPRMLKKGLEQQWPLAEPGHAIPTGEASTPVVLFLHIPKAAGQTLGEFVYHQCRVDGAREDGLLNAGVAYLNYGFIKDQELSVPEHVRSLLDRQDLRAVIGHFWFGLHREIRRSSTYVTMLRNPVHRVLSLYYYAKIHDTMTLDEFISDPPFKEVDNDQTRRIAGVDPPINECTPEMLAQARENLRGHFAVVGTTERFDESLLLMKRTLGWTRDFISSPRNVNAARPEVHSLSPGTIEAIRKRNALDVSLWEYASQLMDDAIIAAGPGFEQELASYRSSLAAS